MDIIIVADRSGKVRTLRVGKFGMICAVALLLAWLAIPALWLPRTHSAATAMTALPPASAERHPDPLFVKESLRTLASKLGELQAKLVRLDNDGDRLAKLAGLRAQDFRFGEAPGRGGPLLARSNSADPLGALTQRLRDLSADVEDRADKFALLDQVLQQRRVEKQSEPRLNPIVGGHATSNFGNRIDPFTNELAFHAGVDFTADAGTDIVAAAGGVVIAAEFQPDYGNMVEIDHGNGLTSRYAHASALHVKLGDIVMQGKRIAEVGSTGRSTGPHLHFEIRENGAATNPLKFLQAGN